MDPLSLTIPLMLMIVFGVASQWLSDLSRVPSILLLLLVGIVIGPLTGFIDPSYVLGNLLTPITSLSVAIILFEGGLSLRFREIKDIGHVIRNLVTFGMISGFVATELFLHYALGFSHAFSMLQSAILVISGPTVIKPILISMRLKPRLSAIIKWEGIITDPFGAALAVIIFEALLTQTGTQAVEAAFFGAVKTLALGAAVGGAATAIIYFSFKHFWVSDKLHGPVTLMFVLLGYCLSNFVQEESGLLTVTIMGMILANQSTVRINHVIDFKENLSVILISFLFIVLAGIIDLKSLESTLFPSTVLFLFLVFVARPFVVLCSGAFFYLPWRESLFLCCLAPRGIVTAVVASLFTMQLARIDYINAASLAPMTITIICMTVLFYSIVARIAAHLLGVSRGAKQSILIIGANDVSGPIAEALVDAGYQLHVIDPNSVKAMDMAAETLPIFPGTFLDFEKQYPDFVEEADMLLAMTESSDINSLAIIHFRHHFDESQLFQLAGSSIDESLKGRELFGKTYVELSQMLAEGAKAKVVMIETQEDLDYMFGNDEMAAVPLFFIDQKGGLTPVTESNNFKPALGDSLLVFDRRTGL